MSNDYFFTIYPEDLSDQQIMIDEALDWANKYRNLEPGAMYVGGAVYEPLISFVRDYNFKEEQNIYSDEYITKTIDQIFKREEVENLLWIWFEYNSFWNQQPLSFSESCQRYIDSCTYSYRVKKACERFNTYLEEHYLNHWAPPDSASGNGASSLYRSSRQEQISNDLFCTCKICFATVQSPYVVEHVNYHSK